MTVTVTPGAVKLSRRLLYAGAFSLLGYCAYVLIDTWTFQRREQREFGELLSVEAPTTPATYVKESPPVGSGGLIGRLEIPSLGVSAIVIEGTNWATLQRAVGHIAGTAQPGQAGNVGISGHRDTFFRPLRNIHRNDIITLTTLSGKFHYRVVSTQVVDPTEVSVLDSGEGEAESLTLITCYPFYYVGSAPKRFVVQARQLGPAMPSDRSSVRAD